MEAAEREQGARSLAVALQRNTNIERLELSNLEDIYAIPILEGLEIQHFFEDFYLFSCYNYFRCNFPCTSTLLGIHDIDTAI